MTKSGSFCTPLLLFLVWRAGEVAESCSCSPKHPQQAFCNADVVLKAKVVGRQEIVTGNDVYGNPIKRIQYDIKQMKMFKGPDREIDAIFTGPSSAVCGVTLDISGKKEYLISGKLESDDTMHVTVCDFVQLWESLTMAQKKGLDSRYQMGCECRIIHCASVPCAISDPAECLWTDWLMENSVEGPQVRHYTCIKRNDDSCAWYRGATAPKKEFLEIEDP